MTLLKKHILREFLVTFGLCFGTFVLIFMLGRGLIEMADLVFNKDVDILLVFKLVLYSMPFLLIFVIPMSVLLASLLTFGKLSHDNEIMAIKASGVSFFKIFLPLLVGVLPLCLACYILADRFGSTSHWAYRQLLLQIGLESPGAALEEGTFIKKFKNFIIFIYEIDKNKLKGIRIYQPQEAKPTRTIIAQKGELITVPEKNLVILRLIHGTSDEPDPKNPAKLYKLNFKTYDLPLGLHGLKNEPLGKKPKEMTVKELKNEIQRLRESGVTVTAPLAAEIHNKIAIAFSSLAFLLIGVPLGITARRSDRAINFGISLGLMTLYWLFFIGGKALAQKGITPPFLSLEFSNLLIGSCGFFLLARR